MNNTVLKLNDVCKNYQRGSETVHALQNANLSVERGEFVAIVGHSGSGKTTLLNIVGGLDHPTSGSVLLSGQDISRADEKTLAKIRKQAIGFVFQQFFLIPTLTVKENVALPGLFLHQPVDDQKIVDLLKRVGLDHRLNHLPGQLSGGEMQRVAVARSLINDAPLILADEPTGNLDSRNAEGIMSIFDELHRDGRTIVVVTHNAELVERSSRVVHIEDGRIK
ncbi:MAG: ABC transporter ATP-binding protein [Fibrobacteres bacterium]|nr:ABC transporter ATP-binding protein [Fibrobacterota bacterium]